MKILKVPMPISQALIRFYHRKLVKCHQGVCLSRGNTFHGSNLLGPYTYFAHSSLGYASYIGRNSRITKTQIGAFSCIGGYVRTGLGRHPTDEFVSIHPAFFSKSKIVGFSFTEKQLFQEHLFADKDRRFFVIIGADVWIGNNVLIMDGLTIGHGAIVAAGSVVTKSVDPYTIVAGIPARPLRKRFSDEDIEFLLRLQWWSKGLKWIQDNASCFTSIDQLRTRCEN